MRTLEEYRALARAGRPTPNPYQAFANAICQLIGIIVVGYILGFSLGAIVMGILT